MTVKEENNREDYEDILQRLNDKDREEIKEDIMIQEDTDAGIKRYMNSNDGNDIGEGIKNMVDSMTDSEKKDTLKKLERDHLSIISNKSKIARKKKNKNQKMSRRKNRK